MMTNSRGGHVKKKKKSKAREGEVQDGKMRKRREGRFMLAVMQKCKHFATFAENNDTAGRRRCACVCSVCFCVCVHERLCGWVQQQHYGERKENDGGEMREREK